MSDSIDPTDPLARWTKRTYFDGGDFVRSPPEVEAFLDEIEAVCKKHGFSISHEDGHGAFVLEPFDSHNIEWLRNASRIISTEPATGDDGEAP